MVKDENVSLPTDSKRLYDRLRFSKLLRIGAKLVGSRLEISLSCKSTETSGGASLRKVEESDCKDPPVS